mgnify:FL=1
MKRIGIWLLLTAMVIPLLAGCSAPETPAAQTENKGKSYFTYFDTVSYVYSYAGDSAEQFDERSAEVSDILGEYHRLFDIYHEYSGVNNLCTLNLNAGGEPIEVDEKLIDFLLYARELYQATDGEMNVMMGAVLRIWHDLRDAASEDPGAARLPTEEELSTAAEHTDFSLLEIDEDARTVRIADPAASIDVGALGKGYATEMAARALEAEGVSSYVLNVGGNIRIIGTKSDGTSWVTGVKDPRNTSEFAIKLRLADTSCVTSGVYERYYTVDGVRYHHIIDKDTLFPAEYFSSLTVITKNSALADALSTALFCMPYDDGAALAEKLGVDVLWIFPDGEMKYTPGIEKLIEE